MKIKNQEKIMGAVKAMLDAEVAHVLYSLPSYPKRKVSAKTLAARRAAVLAEKTRLWQALEDARAALRKAHTEIVHEEYGQ